MEVQIGLKYVIHTIVVNAGAHITHDRTISKQSSPSALPSLSASLNLQVQHLIDSFLGCT